MKSGAYSLAQAIPSAPRVTGPSIATLGQQDLQSSSSLMNAAAGQEANRNAANANMAQEADAGKAQLGASLGAIGGSFVGGPVGAALGGTLGGLLGGLF